MKNLKPVILAVIVGCSCAYFLFRQVELKTKLDDNYNAVAVQIGVFKDAENAEKMKNTYGGQIFKDSDIYRVYYAILKKDANIKFMTDYLAGKGINYYLKDIKVEDDLTDKGEQYEQMMEKSNEEAKLTINKELLHIYEEVI